MTLPPLPRVGRDGSPHAPQHALADIAEPYGGDAFNAGIDRQDVEAACPRRPVR